MIETITLNYDLQSILDILGLIQGITLGMLLLILNYRHHRSTLFLGLFLLLFSLKLAIFIPKGLDLELVYPELFLLPFNFSWLLFPLFFVYTQKVSIFSNQKIKYWVLLPGILSFVFQVVIYFLPYSTKLVIAQSLWNELIFTIIGICYAWMIGIWNLMLLGRHKKEVQNTFASVEFKVLNWARIFLVYSLVTSVFIHILYYISPQNYYFKIIFSIFDLIAIYWVAVNGVRQCDVLSELFKNQNIDSIDLRLSEESKPKKIAKKDMTVFMEKIDDYVRASECFVRKDLTVIDLAEEMGVHPKRISTTINKVKKKKFNNYINELRIKKAEILLTDQSSNYFSIEGVGNEVGFHSKSAFYNAFKKFTGTTPTKYKDLLAA